MRLSYCGGVTSILIAKCRPSEWRQRTHPKEQQVHRLHGTHCWHTTRSLVTFDGTLVKLEVGSHDFFLSHTLNQQLLECTRKWWENLPINSNQKFIWVTRDWTESRTLSKIACACFCEHSCDHILHHQLYFFLYLISFLVPCVDTQVCHVIA